MTLDERLNYLTTTLDAVGSAWARLTPEIQRRIDEKTQKLISAESEQLRGAIKALQEILDLPATLQSERDHINAALSEESDAASQ